MSTAVSNNRAIRGPVTAVPVVAGDGVRLVKDTDNNRIVAELDETVLWENTDQYPEESSITLSENWNNFKYLRVETTEQFGHGSLTNLFDTQSQSFSGARPKRFEVGHYACDITNSKLYIRLLMLSFANSEYKTGTIDVVRVSIGDNTSSFTSGTGDTRLVRVVGVNRISGGN